MGSWSIQQTPARVSILTRVSSESAYHGQLREKGKLSHPFLSKSRHTGWSFLSQGLLLPSWLSCFVSWELGERQVGQTAQKCKLHPFVAEILPDGCQPSGGTETSLLVMGVALDLRGGNVSCVREVFQYGQEYLLFGLLTRYLKGCLSGSMVRSWPNWKLIFRAYWG